MRDILEKTARPEKRVKLGWVLAAIGREARLTKEEARAFDAAVERVCTSADPLSFER